MIKIVEDNLIQMLLGNKIDIIVHGCNCQSTLPIGLGQQIEVTFPEVGTANWRYYIKNRKGSEGILGTYSSYFYKTNRKFGVVNLYTQIWPGPDFREGKMTSGLIKVFNDFGALKRTGNPIRYGMPVIGSDFGFMNQELFISKLEGIVEYCINHGLKDADQLDLTIVS